MPRIYLNKKARRDNVISLLKEYLSDGEWRTLSTMRSFLNENNHSMSTYQIGNCLIRINTIKKKKNDITYHKMLS